MSRKFAVGELALEVDSSGGFIVVKHCIYLGPGTKGIVVGGQEGDKKFLGDGAIDLVKDSM